MENVVNVKVMFVSFTFAQTAVPMSLSLDIFDTHDK